MHTRNGTDQSRALGTRQETGQRTQGAPASATKAPLFTEQSVMARGLVCGGQNRGPRSERRNSMLPLEREREKGKRTASEQRKKSQLSPTLSFFILFSRGGKWQVSILGSKRS